MGTIMFSPPTNFQIFIIPTWANVNPLTFSRNGLNMKSRLNLFGLYHLMICNVPKNFAAWPANATRDVQEGWIGHASSLKVVNAGDFLSAAEAHCHDEWGRPRTPTMDICHRPSQTTGLSVSICPLSLLNRKAWKIDLSMLLKNIKALFKT